MTSKLAGKAALVTGGSAGIGLGIAKHLPGRRAGVYHRPPPVRAR